MPGPPPSRNPRRRNARPDWRALPAAGRKGEAPKWPLASRVKGSVDLWRDLWSRPQAVAWDEDGQERVVARYVLLVLEAEKPDASAALLSEVRQLEDRIGLNPLAMKRLLWEVVDLPAGDGDDGEVIDLDDYRELYGAGST